MDTNLINELAATIQSPLPPPGGSLNEADLDRARAFVGKVRSCMETGASATDAIAMTADIYPEAGDRKFGDWINALQRDIGGRLYLKTCIAVCASNRSNTII